MIVRLYCWELERLLGCGARLCDVARLVEDLAAVVYFDAGGAS